MANIVANIHLQDSLPMQIQQFVDFLTKWSYNAVTVDLFLKTCYKIFSPFVPINPPQRLASRFNESWRKFLSLIGKWYKSLAEAGDPLASDLAAEDALKDDYDVAKEAKEAATA